MQRLSRYLRNRIRDGTVTLFHELHPDPAYVSQATWEKLQVTPVVALDSELATTLKQRRLLITSDAEDDLELETATANLNRKLDQPTILYLMLAQGCNCDCTYCPIPEMAKRYGESLLSIEDATAGVDLWSRHVWESYDPDRHYYIIFYGGEPLLNKEAFTATLAYIRESVSRGQLPRTNLHLMLVTNGTLVDEDIANLCREHKISIVIGLDGPEEQNDAFRIYQDGHGSFGDATRAIRLLAQKGVSISASVSITPKNIDQLPSFSSFFKELGVAKFGFNFLRGKQALAVIPRDELDGYYRRAARQVIACFRVWSQPTLEYQMEKKWRVVVDQDPFPVDCTCYGNQLVVQADGQISNCPFAKPFLGHIRSVGPDFRIARTELVQHWRKRLPLFHEGYRDCDAKAWCGGGCACASVELTGDPLAVDRGMKIFAEEVLDELIWLELGQNRIF